MSGPRVPDTRGPDVEFHVNPPDPVATALGITAKTYAADLEAELAALPPRRRASAGACFTCNLPEPLRVALEADRASATPHSFIQWSRLLARRGLTITPEGLAGHFRKGHAR